MAISPIFLLALFSLISGNGVLPIDASHHVYRNLQSLSSDSSNQPYGTAYHFQPPKSWINGPMRCRGLYHLLYHYNPKGAVWGNIVWAHYVSNDLVNWTPLDPAIYPSQQSDSNGCWLSSATMLRGGKPVILYPGIDPMNRHVQNLAIPKNMSDRFLKEWVKSPKNPSMAPTIANKINSSLFRDPTTAWLGKDGYWMVLTGSNRNTRGMAIWYKSKMHVYLQTIPRAIWLHKSGKQLVQRPVQEIEKLCVNPVNWPTKVLNGGELLQVTGVSVAQADVEISFEVNEYGEAEVLDNWTEPQILGGRKGAAVKGSPRLFAFGLLVVSAEDIPHEGPRYGDPNKVWKPPRTEDASAPMDATTRIEVVSNAPVKLPVIIGFVILFFNIILIIF